eukprot:jgi/Chrpa1/7643/Chrysochromulina_OHIO_Genome00015020-RA
MPISFGYCLPIIALTDLITSSIPFRSARSLGPEARPACGIARYLSPERTSTNTSGRHSSAKRASARVSGSENGRGPRYWLEPSPAAPAAQSTSQLRFTSTPRALSRRSLQLPLPTSARRREYGDCTGTIFMTTCRSISAIRSRERSGSPANREGASPQSI